MDSLSKLIKFANCNKHVQESLNVIEAAFSKYNVENTCISFNGGKDCTAVLHLVHSIARKFGPNNNEHKLLAFYAKLPNHFQEEYDFVQATVERYNLRLLQYSSSSLKESLSYLKAEFPHVEAIFIGTRKDDFKSTAHVSAFAPTDSDWPKFMRVNPIVDWSYQQVWDFIRQLDVPYCDLYNQGYSSLGTRDDTAKNSSLLRFNDKGEPYYIAPWNLASSQEERLSRSSSLDVSNKNSNT